MHNVVTLADRRGEVEVQRWARRFADDLVSCWDDDFASALSADLAGDQMESRAKEALRLELEKRGVRL